MKPPARTGLLVSVRSVEEAEAALAGGADIIDVKEPSRGSLGRADNDTIAAILRAVAGRRLVSAAMGELQADNLTMQTTSGLPYGLDYLKWGLAGWSTRQVDAWADQLAYIGSHLQRYHPRSKPIVVAYADWQRANAPSPQAVWTGIREVRIGPVRTFKCQGLLLDTWQKDGTTLLDWLTFKDVTLLVEFCRSAGLPIALAGSLGMKEIAALQPLRPDWFAVRGAACAKGQRDQSVDAERVRRLAECVARPLAGAAR